MYTYDAVKGWSEIDDFLSKTKGGDLSEELRLAGYYSSPAGQLGDEFSYFNVEIYPKDESAKNTLVPYDFIVIVDVGTYSEVVPVNDFPSLVELLSKLSTTSGTSFFTAAELEKQQNT